MIDHLGIDVSDIQRAKAFYLKALAPLGYEVVMEFEGVAGLGANKKPDFWIHQGGKTSPKLHIAFLAPNRKAVDAFYKAAIAAGATDNGAPGLREMYHPTYYGAFVIDLDGHNLEAVVHTPE